MAKSKHVNNPWGGFFFVLPSILAMVVFVYGMIGWTVNVSFGKRVNAYTNAKGYVGFKNYKDLFGDSEFTHAFTNLLKFTGVFKIGRAHV